MDPLDYMVEDCWLHLLHFLSPKDKQALCDTCETFQTMLQPQKTQWGFELILPLIMKKLDIRRRNPSSEQIKKALSLRSVCKSWGSAFDKICGLCAVRGTPHFALFNHIHSFYDFNVAQLERFHKMFQTRSGNPFVGNYVKIYASSFEEPLELEGDALDGNKSENPEASAGGNEIEERQLSNCQLLMDLLPKHGQKIFYLSVKNSTYADGMGICGQMDACKFFQFVLSNTPNLHRLELSLRPHGRNLDEDTFKNEVKEYFKVNPLSEKPSIKELYLFGINPTLENLMLRAYGRNLIILHLYNNTSTIPIPLWSNMHYLRELVLRNSSFERTEKILCALDAPLEVLDIQSDTNGREIPIQNTGKIFFIDKFLLAAQHLPLKTVSIYPDCGVLKESAPFPKDFPRHMTITYFKISNITSISHSYAQFLPHLKHWWWRGDRFKHINMLSFY